MSKINIDISSVNSAEVLLKNAKNTTADVRNSVNSVRNGVDGKIKSKNSIDSRFVLISNKLSDVESIISDINRTVNDGLQKYNSADSVIERKANDIRNDGSDRRKELLSFFGGGGGGSRGITDPVENLKGLFEDFIDFINNKGDSNSQADKNKIIEILNLLSEKAGEIYNSLNLDTDTNYEVSDDGVLSILSSLFSVTFGSTVVSILGEEKISNLEKIFDKDIYKEYLLKVKTENSEQYLLKKEKTSGIELKSEKKDNEFKDRHEDIFKDKGWYEEKNKTKYYKDGKEISEDDAPTFYKRKATIAEVDVSGSASVSIYEGTYNYSENGKVSATVGKAEAHASISGGFYVVGADGEKGRFSPGVKAEVGVSVTALEAEWEQQLLGDENFGLNADAKATVGKAAANAEVGFQILGEDGKVDVQIGAKGEAELIGGEIEGSLGVNILGGEVGVKGSVNYGIGAHAEVGYRDGVFKCDLGVSVGLGVSLGFEVDVGGMVDTVVDAASSAWEGVKDGWNSFWSMW